MVVPPLDIGYVLQSGTETGSVAHSYQVQVRTDSGTVCIPLGGDQILRQSKIVGYRY